MSTVHSVSDITNRLSTIIRKAPTLQDVWVHGKVSSKTPSEEDRPDFFMLEDAKNGDKIECIIYKENAHLFEVLPTTQNDVVVNGRIVLFEPKSEYRFAVTDIKTPATALKGKVFSVSDLTSNLQTALKVHSGKVQGKISNNPVISQTGFLHLYLKNSNNGEMIVCVLPPNISRNPPFLLQTDTEVSIQGKFDIFTLMSQYQIKIASPNDIQLVSSDRDENGQTVVNAVHAYFNRFETDEFSVEREHEIQFGARSGFADVVLIDQNGSFAAIAECKVAGHVGYGVKQLQSYLCATDTRFGIFANRIYPEKWEFYENRRRNRIDPIDRSEFEAGVVKSIATRERLKDEIKALEKTKDDLENKKSKLETEIARLRQTESELQSTHKQLISEIGKKHVQQSELETEIGKLAKTKYDLQDTSKQIRKEIEATTQQHADIKWEIAELRNQKLELETKIGHLQQKESELRTSHKQRKEKIQQFETLFNDLKSDLLDSEPPSRSDNNIDSQRTGTGKKLGIVSKLKTYFQRRTNDLIITTESKRYTIIHFGDYGQD